MQSFDFDTSLSKVAFLKQLTLDSSSFLTSFIWPSEATTSDKIKTFTVCEGHQLFVFHHSVQRNSTDLRSSTCDGFFFYKICSVLKGGIQHLKTTCQWEHMRMKTSDRKYAFRSLCCHSRIALFACARNTRTFPANWQVDIFTFRHLIKPRGGRKRVVKEFLTGSLPPFLALVLPHFFLSLSLFPRPQLPRAWNRLTWKWLAAIHRNMYKLIKILSNLQEYV